MPTLDSPPITYPVNEEDVPEEEIHALLEWLNSAEHSEFYEVTGMGDVRVSALLRSRPFGRLGDLFRVPDIKGGMILRMLSYLAGRRAASRPVVKPSPLTVVGQGQFLRLQQDAELLLAAVKVVQDGLMQWDPICGWTRAALPESGVVSNLAAKLEMDMAMLRQCQQLERAQ